MKLKRACKRGVAPVFAGILMVVLVVIAAAGIYYYVKHEAELAKKAGEKIESIEKLVVTKVVWRGVGVAFATGLSKPGCSVYVSKDGNSWRQARVISEKIVPGGLSKIMFSTRSLEPGEYWVMVKSSSGASGKAKMRVNGRVLLESPGFHWSLYYRVSGSSLNPLPGFTYTIYDIRGMQTLPDPSSILGLGKDRVLARGAVERVDFTDNPSYGGDYWPQSQTDRFAAVFNTTLILPVDCSCTFDFYVDDAVALYVDGSMVFSSWKLQAPKSYSFTTTLTRGIHRVTVVYMENYGTARLRVDIECTPASSSPFDVLQIKGYYYDTSSDNPRNPDPSKVEGGGYPLILARDESYIDYNDHGGNSWPISQTDEFAARYKVLLQVNQDGYYRFYAESDDGIIIKLNGSTIISDWSLHGTRRYEKKLLLHQGVYEVTILYYENRGVARLLFRVEFTGETGILELTPSYKAHVYDISGWSNWWDLSSLESYIRSGAFPLIGEYDVDYINYTDNSNYGGDPWFFHGSGNVDNFAVVFNATLAISYPGTLQVTAYSDDGVKVYIDDKLVLSDWSLHAPRTAKAKTPIEQGEHSLIILYFEHYGIARLKITLYLKETRVYNYPALDKTLYIEDPNGILKGHIVLVIGEDGSILAEERISETGLLSVPLTEEQNSKVILVVVS